MPLVPRAGERAAPPLPEFAPPVQREVAVAAPTAVIGAVAEQQRRPFQARGVQQGLDVVLPLRSRGARVPSRGAASKRPQSAGRTAFPLTAA
jgi:hypothetical protein